MASACVLFGFGKLPLEYLRKFFHIVPGVFSAPKGAVVMQERPAVAGQRYAPQARPDGVSGCQFHLIGPHLQNLIIVPLGKGPTLVAEKQVHLVGNQQHV